MEIILLCGIRRHTAMILVTLLFLCGMVVNGRPRREKTMERGEHRDVVTTDDVKHQGAVELLPLANTSASLLQNALSGIGKDPSSGVFEAQIVTNDNNNIGDREIDNQAKALHNLLQNNIIDANVDRENRRAENINNVVNHALLNAGDDEEGNNLAGNKIITIHTQNRVDGNNGVNAVNLNNNIGDSITGQNELSNVVANGRQVTDAVAGGQHNNRGTHHQNNFVTNSMNDLNGHGNLIQLEEHHSIASFRDEAQNQAHNLYQGSSNLARENANSLINHAGNNNLLNGPRANQVITIGTGDNGRGNNLNLGNDVLMSRLVNLLRQSIGRQQDIEDPRTLSQSLTSTIADTLESASANGENPNHISLRDVVDIVNSLRGNYREGVRNIHDRNTPVVISSNTISDTDANRINNVDLTNRLRDSFSTILTDIVRNNGRVDCNRNLNLNNRVSDDEDYNCGNSVIYPTTNGQGKVVIIKQGSGQNGRVGNVLTNVPEVGTQPALQIRLNNGILNNRYPNEIVDTNVGNHRVVTTGATTNGMEARRAELLQLAGFLDSLLSNVGIGNVPGIRKHMVSKAVAKRKNKIKHKSRKEQAQIGVQSGVEKPHKSFVKQQTKYKNQKMKLEKEIKMDSKFHQKALKVNKIKKKQ